MSTLPRNLTLPLPLRLSSESEIPRSGEDEGRASEVGGVWVPADDGLDVELEPGKVKCETKAIPRQHKGSRKTSVIVLPEPDGVYRAN